MYDVLLVVEEDRAQGAFRALVRFPVDDHQVVVRERLPVLRRGIFGVIPAHQDLALHVGLERKRPRTLTGTTAAFADPVPDEVSQSAPIVVRMKARAQQQDYQEHETH